MENAKALQLWERFLKLIGQEKLVIANTEGFVIASKGNPYNC